MQSNDHRHQFDKKVRNQTTDSVYSSCQQPLGKQPSVEPTEREN